MRALLGVQWGMVRPWSANVALIVAGLVNLALMPPAAISWWSPAAGATILASGLGPLALASVTSPKEGTMPFPYLPATRGLRRGVAFGWAMVIAGALVTNGVVLTSLRRGEPFDVVGGLLPALGACWATLGVLFLLQRRTPRPFFDAFPGSSPTVGSYLGRRLLTGVGGLALAGVVLGVMLSRTTLAAYLGFCLFVAAGVPLLPARLAGQLLGTRSGGRGPLTWLPLRQGRARLLAGLGSVACGVPFAVVDLVLRATAPVRESRLRAIDVPTLLLFLLAAWIAVPATVLGPLHWTRRRTVLLAVIAMMSVFGTAAGGTLALISSLAGNAPGVLPPRLFASFLVVAAVALVAKK